MSIIALDDIPGIVSEPNSQGGMDYELNGVKAGYGRNPHAGEGTDPWLYFVSIKGPYSHPTEEGCKIGIKSLLAKFGAWESAPIGNTHLDATDRAIFEQRQEQRGQRSALDPRPLCGDVLILRDGEETRVIGRHGEFVTYCADASFSLMWGGEGSYSGGNDGHLVLGDIERDGTAEAVFWFPHHDKLRAGCRVDVRVEVTRWRVPG